MNLQSLLMQNDAYLHGKFMKCFISFLSLLILASCANIVAPTGGPQDRTAPKILERTLADSALQFKGGVVKINFDENIDSKGIVVETFPLLATPPKVSVYKRTLSIVLPDSLLEANTTYKINLGNSIKDIYEGTPYANLSFTFSTGTSLDSLLVQGTVTDAATGKPDTGVHVLLYSKINSDSDITFKRPLYVTKTNDIGVFTFSNLPNKEFYIYAVKNINNNYVYDAAGERIAFLTSTVLPSATNTIIPLLSFMQTVDTNKNILKSKRFGASVAPTNNITTNIDTTAPTKRTLDITQPITITSNKKIENWDASKIRLYQDSVLDASTTITLDTSKTKINIIADFTQDANYYLQLLDGYIVDSIKNLGAKTFAFKTKKESDYGTIKVMYNRDLKSYKHILELWLADKLIATRLMSNGAENFTMLNPGTYTLRVIHDANNNGVWDNGNYNNKLQPEKTEAYTQPILLKANMENKIVWEEPGIRKK